MIMDLWVQFDSLNSAGPYNETRLHKLDCNENWLIKYLAKFSR